MEDANAVEDSHHDIRSAAQLLTSKQRSRLGIDVGGMLDTKLALCQSHSHTGWGKSMIGGHDKQAGQSGLW